MATSHGGNPGNSDAGRGRADPRAGDGNSRGDAQVCEDGATGGLLEVKIVSLDYYRRRQGGRQAPDGPRLPVVRVYGVARDSGKKIVVHVHGVMPYFFVRVPEMLAGSMARHQGVVPSCKGECDEEHFGSVFWRALDGALELHHACYGVAEGHEGQERTHDRHSLPATHLFQRRVAGVQLVKATPFYGYHKHEALWLKIYLFDPSDVKRAATLVNSGAVLGMRFQPHESHIPYLLQFKIDHNLYGMDWLRLKGGCFRAGNLAAATQNGTAGPRGDLPCGFMVSDAVDRQTTCALELDVSYLDIVNTYEKKRVDITAAPMEEQVVDSLAPIWAEERDRQGRWDVGPTPVEVTRRVEQIDSTTVGYWREKFREAEKRRVGREGCDDDGVVGDRAGTVFGAVSAANEPGSQALLDSQPSSQHQASSQSQPFSYSPSSPADILGSLVNVDAVRSTQWAPPGGLSNASNLSSSGRKNNTIDDYNERQRELGYIWRENEDNASDDNDQLMELVELIRAGEGAQTQLTSSQRDREEAPSRYCLERRVQNALQEGTVSAQNECHDIIEASQMFDAEMMMSRARQDDNTDVVNAALVQVPGPESRTGNRCDTYFSSEREREQVLEAGRRLSEIRELFSGKPRRDRRTSDGVAAIPKKKDEQNEQGGAANTAGMPPPPPRTETNDKRMTSQEKIDFWSEPVSQVPFYEDMDDESEMKANTLEEHDVITILEPTRKPPSRTEVTAMPVVHTGPHFSNASDIYTRVQVFGGQKHHLKTSAVAEMPCFGSVKDYMESKLAELNAGYCALGQPPKDSNVPQSNTDANWSLLLELPYRPPIRSAVDRWVAEMREAQVSIRKATMAAVVSHAPGAPTTLDANSGKFLPQAADEKSQASLLGTPLLPSWHGEDDDGCTNAPRLSLPLTNSANLGRATFPNSTATPPPEQKMVQPASPKYDEVDVLYKDVLNGKDTDGQFFRRCSRAHPVQRQSFSQISWGNPRSEGVTPESQMGLNPFKKSPMKGEGLTILCVEVHAESRQGLLPDPTRDAICAAVLTMYEDCEMITSGQYYTRIIMVKQRERIWPNFEGMHDVDFDFVTSERELFSRFRETVRTLDPDILLGFEIQKSSFGYLADRARCAFQNASFLSDISRVPSEQVEMAELGENDQYGWDHDSGFRVAGRIVLNMWRIIRAEVKLSSYSFENCVAAILKIRVPHIKRPALHSLFKRHETRWRCLSHYVLCNRLCLHMIEQLDFVRRTSELARTFGIDFFSVISRGSQYRVESMMIRLAHSQNYIALSPDNEQVARQPAMEALPLVMEPESGMYEDPVCVLDFQSLYPSMIIAYNLCFSTCIGRPGHLFAAKVEGDDASVTDEDGKQNQKSSRSPRPPRLGCLESFTLDASLASSNIDPSNPADLIVTPNGIGFVKPTHRRGVLPRLLHEILQTRIMIKSAMRKAPTDAKSLSRSLNAKQFALKLIANVTYGYTAAGFSGRMPMAELADAIVQSGRETLEDTIRYIKKHPDWRADVIYGDTDSIFVRLRGRTLDEAHRIGQEIAKAITARNPDPVLLKLEKVYHPCFLLSKKRYVGAMYESPDQAKFQFDAKGIETVRRDSCPAVSKIVEQSLRILFTSADVSAVKAYVERQWKRIISGRVSVMDFIFAKEVRLGTYAGERGINTSSIPPAALVATKAMAKDPRREPRFGERISYVVVHGEPGARLIDMVVEPEALVESGGTLRLHAVYYITKQIIPALERFMRLIGVNVQTWYARIPKTTRFLPHKRPLNALGTLGTLRTLGNAGPKPKSTIDHFYLSRHCICCDALTMVNEPLCRACQDEKQLVALALPLRLNRIERQYVHIARICSSCGGTGAGGQVICESLDCSLYFERRKVWYERKTVEALARCLHDDPS